MRGRTGPTHNVFSPCGRVLLLDALLVFLHVTGRTKTHRNDQRNELLFDGQISWNIRA